MPTQKQAANRGGVVKVRRKKLPDGSYLNIYVMKKKGPRGGKTIADRVKPKTRIGTTGKTHTTKGR